jgi:hypothetical protein
MWWREGRLSDEGDKAEPKWRRLEKLAYEIQKEVDDGSVRRPGPT